MRPVPSSRKKKALFFGRGWPPPLPGRQVLPEFEAAQTADRFFRSKFMTARSNKSPKEESSAERWARKAAPRGYVLEDFTDAWKRYCSPKTS